MILKDFDDVNRFAYYYKNNFKIIDSSTIKKEDALGFFQYHELGVVILVLKDNIPYFIIDKLKFRFNQVKEIDYFVDGENREFIVNAGETLRFNYKAFWFNEVSMIEFALGYPEDDISDLIKLIVNKVKLYMS
jgi:hypothetical protein